MPKHFKKLCFSLGILLGTWAHAPTGLAAERFQTPVLRFIDTPEQIPSAYLEQRILEWLSTAEELPGAEAQLSSFLQDLYLQRGNPNVQIQVQNLFSKQPQISIQEHFNDPIMLERMTIKGGTPLQRWLVRHNLYPAEEGSPFDYQAILQDLHWLEHNQFLPLALHFSSTGAGKIGLEVEILTSSAIIPTGNIAINNIVGTALTAGVITDNYLLEGSVFRVMVKRNNIPLLSSSSNLVQDWEYVVGASSNDLPWPGVTAGFNQYNKVDYIYRGLGSDPNQLTWIQSFGGDFYSGFPIWSDPESHRYLRGVANLSILQDTFFNGPDNQAPNPPLSQSGRQSDLLYLPSMNLIFSDVDDFIIPRNGNFLRFQLAGSLGDVRYLQGTASGFSFWSPWMEDNWQGTFLFRNALGSTFGQNVPFYRGFLNTGNWLVRGAREYSITEKHSVRTAQEFHLFYRPTLLQLDALFEKFTGQKELGTYLEGWAFDANLFMDEGAYWRDSLNPRLMQFSLGIGINAITPTGSILGVDMAFPVYPQPAGPTFLLRITAPLAFTLYADWINSNGFFLR
ncbi:hypothetical protein COW36_03635 [bacterium (Candidatus Blackallbacteria) CG17_big_fil_post_rev_8_21_14_2_50_48_46]|uniref:Bacterial surface antigen (D15) domain-containing protein n=1 Tax=bacterium (Candidatus Blackallbacteria) CG17_big_fil_post_rev_8_21_14_2_50_48_46 TaxID=2014261 RepID=A0A2M7G960_9BACT|nr:MAG: hypothetical protein COW64_20805 [bacterium (Candidatus Blackallbacteria) CG18_big_fil_WC_8_21_14_2_50_49_26]PIW18394.1 MAG: hypothetical protein COW36_03635 [bacterium (Candidatus Blackallbacteria) CG17_big_fil_post_rev_8_21_14_2_50_48_46]PIW50553.1 MAG: hypothetical protein COW20_02060 [bacterium (Candidatus Blackallbacteria) CG13_big_fil_rev_8_21_14_2_50_49_14]